MLGLLLHLLHQPGALDDVGIAGIVFDIGGDGELAAGLDALDQDRLEHGARRIDRGGVASRTGPDNDDLGMGRFRHFGIPSLDFGKARSHVSAAPRGAAKRGFAAGNLFELSAMQYAQC